MIESAISLGFDSLGFSGHAPTEQDTSWETRRSRVEDYIREVTALKEEYRGKINVFIGFELDLYSKGLVDTSGLDYAIGSVHMAKKDGTWYDFDHCYEEVRRSIDTLFGGDPIAYTKSYYENLVTMARTVDFDIVGHFDLCYKHGKNAVFYDVDRKEYKNAAIGAIEALAGKIPYFEVNTGCMPRGYKDVPYPLPFIIKEMKRCGFGAVITSDCHNAEYLDYGFAEARKLLSECGYNETFILTDSGFKPIEI